MGMSEWHQKRKSKSKRRRQNEGRGRKTEEGRRGDAADEEGRFSTHYLGPSLR